MENSYTHSFGFDAFADTNVPGFEPIPLLLETHGRHLCECVCVVTQQNLTQNEEDTIEAAFIGNVNCVWIQKKKRNTFKKPTPCYYC